MKKFLVLFVVFDIFVLYCFQTYIRAPQDTIYPIEVSYAPGESVGQFVQKIHDAKVIKSSEVFKILLVLQGYDRTLKPNMYVFEQAENVFNVVRKIGTDSRQAKGIKVVIPEGSTNLDIAARLSYAFPNITFVEVKNSPEGYFFPDTYFFSVNSTEADIITKLKATFDQKTQILFEGKTEQEKKDTIIMASILEKEGRTKEERHVISGILTKRLSLGMPLQVDATFLYTLGKGSSELSIADLQKDSPYNTYTRTGLPIGPINNPGIETIEAALNPTTSPYLFYLHSNQYPHNL
jgi:UPF0755 protein